MTLAKVCILGEVSVGKTSLVRRFIDRTFSDTYLSTVGVNISRKLLRLPSASGLESVDLQLILWDLQGGQNFKYISSSYLRGAMGAIVVGDLTRDTTLDALEDHIEHFRGINPAGIVVVALNKSDLQRDSSEAMQSRWAHREGIIAALYTSAKTGEGVDKLFDTLGNHFLLGMKNGPAH